MPSLSILCVSKGELCAISLLRKLKFDAIEIGAEFVLVADGQEARKRLSQELRGSRYYFPSSVVNSNGSIESVLDEAISFTDSEYILRVDDDESISPAMLAWLARREYEKDSHWMFPRLNLWQDAEHYISTPPLYPDYQTRLSTREKSGGRYALHCGSPYGGGTLAPVSLHHHKFLTKSREERQAIADRYERLQVGAGVDFMCFSVPETLGSKLTIKHISEAGENV